RVRDANEDQFLIADLNKSMQVHQTSLGLDHQTRLFGNSQGKLLLVADGMGGQAAGERASLIAVDTITTTLLNTIHWLFRLDDDGEGDFIEHLKSALHQCQRQIQQDVQKVPRRAGMGTTLTMAYVVWPRLFVIHAGDSRCYLHRGGQLDQVTRDHTMAQQFLESGALDAQEARRSRWSHMLWNVIGGSSEKLFAEAYKAELRLGDVLLLCTDGLTNLVGDERIVQMLDSQRPAAETCRRLVEAANNAGGQDNITAIVARFLDTSEGDALADEAEEPIPSEADTVIEPAPAEIHAATSEQALADPVPTVVSRLPDE
ncbi:MAG: PP2C family protein-serine/threonine phosphatase, partial [Planctomycetaceae bacterium]